MLELELELAYRESQHRVHVRSAVGTFVARVLRAGAFVAIVVPLDGPVGAAEFVTGLPEDDVVAVVDRSEVLG